MARALLQHDPHSPILKSHLLPLSVLHLLEEQSSIPLEFPSSSTPNEPPSPPLSVRPTSTPTHGTADPMHDGTDNRDPQKSAATGVTEESFHKGGSSTETESTEHRPSSPRAARREAVKAEPCVVVDDTFLDANSNVERSLSGRRALNRRRSQQVTREASMRDNNDRPGSLKASTIIDDATSAATPAIAAAASLL